MVLDDGHLLNQKVIHFYRCALQNLDLSWKDVYESIVQDLTKYQRKRVEEIHSYCQNPTLSRSTKHKPIDEKLFIKKALEIHHKLFTMLSDFGYDEIANFHYHCYRDLLNLLDLMTDGRISYRHILDGA